MTNRISVQPSISPDLLYYEIFPQLSPTDIYAYCRSSKDNVNLCNDVEFWINYLAEMENDEIQRLAIEAAEDDNLPFTRMLIDHADELYVLLDEKTKRQSYYLYADHKNWDAVRYLANRIEYGYGIVVDDDFETVWTIIDQIVALIEQMVKKAGKATKSLTNEQLAPLGELYQQLMKLRADHDYIGTKIVERLTSDVVVRFLEFDAAAISARVKANVVRLNADLFGAYLLTLGPDSPNLLNRLFKRSSYAHDHYITSLKVDIIAQNITYDLYMKIRQYFKGMNYIGVPYDSKLWRYLYKEQSHNRERFLERGYRGLDVEEWLDLLSSHDEDERYRIINHALMNAQLEGYTLWTMRLKEILTDRSDLLPEKSRTFYLVWRPSTTPTDCVVVLTESPTQALMLCEPDSTIDIDRQYYLGKESISTSDTKKHNNRCVAVSFANRSKTGYLYVEKYYNEYKLSSNEFLYEYSLYTEIAPLKDELTTLLARMDDDRNDEYYNADAEQLYIQDAIEDALPRGVLYGNMRRSEWTLIDFSTFL